MTLEGQTQWGAEHSLLVKKKKLLPLSLFLELEIKNDFWSIYTGESYLHYWSSPEGSKSTEGPSMNLGSAHRQY